MQQDSHCRHDSSGVFAFLHPGILARGLCFLNISCGGLQRNERLFIVFKGGIGIEPASGKESVEIYLDLTCQPRQLVTLQAPKALQNFLLDQEGATLL
jgi:hypothetical protein